MKISQPSSFRRTLTFCISPKLSDLMIADGSRFTLPVNARDNIIYKIKIDNWSCKSSASKQIIRMYVNMQVNATQIANGIKVSIPMFCANPPYLKNNMDNINGKRDHINASTKIKIVFRNKKRDLTFFRSDLFFLRRFFTSRVNIFLALSQEIKKTYNTKSNPYVKIVN